MTGLAAVTAVVVVFIVDVTVRDFMVGAAVGELQVLVGLTGVVSDIFVFFCACFFLDASWLPSSGLVFSEKVAGFPLLIWVGGVPGHSLT